MTVRRAVLHRSRSRCLAAASTTVAGASGTKLAEAIGKAARAAFERQRQHLARSWHAMPVRRQLRTVAERRLMSPYGAFSCSDGGWKSPGVAQSLSLLAPCLAPRDLVIFANVRASKNSIDRARDGAGRLREPTTRPVSLNLFHPVMPRESAIREWPWRADRRATGSSGAYGECARS